METTGTKKLWKVIMGKRKLNIALLFGILVSCLFGNAFAANVPPEYNFYPLYFPYISGSLDSTDVLAKHKAEWDYLMKFKIFGQDTIAFLGRDINIPDKTGWFGTAAGGWSLANEWHRVGGPILIGGDVTFTDGQDTIITGPMRVLGDVSVGNFNPTNAVNGDICIAKSITGNASRFVNAVAPDKRHFSGYLSYSKCGDSVPEVKTNLTIPVVIDSLLPPIGNSIIYNCPNPAGIRKGSVCINNTTGYIDVPPSDKENAEERDADVYDLHIMDFSLLNQNHLIIRMPSTGRLTRIFIDGNFKVNSFSHIQIVYMSDDTTYAKYDTDSLKWIIKPVANGNYDSSYRAIQNDKYTGNLLFFSKNDMVWDALNPTDSIQGTFISQGTIHVKQHMTLAGQLLAKRILIDSQFDGSGFIFVPFNPPKIDPGALARGSYKENDKLVPIDIKLDKAPQTDVRFNYCFKTPAKDSAGFNFAEPEDIKDASPADMPRCGATSGSRIDSVLIHADSLYPTDSVYKAWVRVAKDGVVEGDEWFYICISNLSGAIIKGNYPTFSSFEK